MESSSQADVEHDSEPFPEEYDVPCTTPYLFDVVVIYTKKDYTEVNDEFVPWLKGIASKFELDGVDGARIHLFDDPDVTQEHNVFSQTTNVSKCMKILAFITDNFLKDEILTGVLQELIMMTRFITKEEVEEHILNIRGKLPPVHVKCLSECVQRQKKNAIIPVQTQERKINFVGLKSIVPLPYHDREEYPGFTERSAKNIIELALKDRKKLQETFPGHEQRNYRSSQECPNTSSREHQQGSLYSTNIQVVSNVRFQQDRGYHQSHRAQNEIADNWSANSNNLSTRLLFPSNQLQTNYNEVTADKENNDIRAPNTGSSQASSSRMNGNGQRNSVESGLGIDESLGSASNNMSEVSTFSENHPRTETSGEIKTPEHGGPALTSDQVTENSRPDLEEDQLESGQASNTDNTEIKTVLTESEQASNTEIKTVLTESGQASNIEIKTVLTESGQANNTEIKTVLTESGYGSLPGQGQMKQNDGATTVTELSDETSLENTSLVNDCGDAALGKDPDNTNLNTSEEESMPSVDAQNVDGKSNLLSKKWKSGIEDSKVLEHTLTYTGMPQHTGRGLIAGNDVPQKDKRYSPVGSDVPESTSHFKNKQPLDFADTLYPYLAGAKDGPVLTIVHHHVYEKPEPKPPSPSRQPDQKTSQTINVYGANAVLVGKHSQSVMTNPTLVSKGNPTSDQPESDVPTTQQTTQKDKQSDSGEECTPGTPTTCSGPFNDLSSVQPSTYNFTKSTEDSKEWQENDCKNTEGKTTALQSKGRTNSDSCDNSSSDEDNSLVGTHIPTSEATVGGVPESNRETKERNLNDTEENNDQTMNKSDLSSLDVNSLWQSEAEDILGPSLSDEIESLAASGEIDTLSQQPDVRESGGAAEGQGQVRMEPQICFIEGPQPESELQTNSLFVSTLNQRFIHTRTTKTNALSMMSQNATFLQEVRVKHHYEEDEVD